MGQASPAHGRACAAQARAAGAHGWAGAMHAKVCAAPVRPREENAEKTELDVERAVGESTVRVIRPFGFSQYAGAPHCEG